MEIRNHLLQGDGVKYIPSPTHSGEFKAGNLDTLIMHYTGGPTAESAINTMINPTVKASAHVVVGRDGKITQLVPFNIIAWHAGNSSWKGRVGFNSYSIGIEIVNLGPLTKSGDIFRSAYGKIIDAKDVIEGTHRNETTPRFWQTYTSEQLDTVLSLAELIINTYALKMVLGHEEISPGRKTDPGPAFPLDKIRQKLLNPHRTDDEDVKLKTGKVIVQKLNVRTQPNPTSDKATLPLIEGAKVNILDEDNGWYKINVTNQVEGWVDGRFLVKE